MIKPFTHHGWHYMPRLDLLHDGFGYMWERGDLNADRPTFSMPVYVPSNRPTRAMVVRAFMEGC